MVDHASAESLSELFNFSANLEIHICAWTPVTDAPPLFPWWDLGTRRRRRPRGIVGGRWGEPSMATMLQGTAQNALRLSAPCRLARCRAVAAVTTCKISPGAHHSSSGPSWASKAPGVRGGGVWMRLS